MFSRDELELIGRLCERWNALAITDEIYEHLVYEGQHVSLATLPGLRERGLAVVPGTSFYPPPDRSDCQRPGSQRVRFSFPKRMETLRRAAERLVDLPGRPSSATEHTE